MNNAEAVALWQLLQQLETPQARQFWRQAQTHDNDHTCVVTDPTELEIHAIAQLMKERTVS
jgi:hypothetical protein